MNNKKRGQISNFEFFGHLFSHYPFIFIIIQSSINARDFHENSSSSVVSQNLIFLFSGPDAGDMTVLILLSSSIRKSDGPKDFSFLNGNHSTIGGGCVFFTLRGYGRGSFCKENFIFFLSFANKKAYG